MALSWPLIFLGSTRPLSTAPPSVRSHLLTRHHLPTISATALATPQQFPSLHHHFHKTPRPTAENHSCPLQHLIPTVHLPSRSLGNMDLSLFTAGAFGLWFYEGAVKSYNPGKKKHVILYDDGDVEVLQLVKEQWEVISEGSEPSKQLKSSNVSPSKGIFRRKTTIKKNVENSHSGMSESNIGANASDYAEGRDTPELSDSHPNTSPEVNEVDSDDFANEQASPSAAAKEEEREAPTDLEESDREEKMDSSDRGALGDSDDEPLSMWIWLCCHCPNHGLWI